MNFTPAFYSKLQFEDNGGLPFTLLQPLTYVTDVDHRGTFVVPAGFQTDLASIPRLLQNIFPQVGKYDAAAVVHDFLYQHAGKMWADAPLLTRKQCDNVFLEAMGVLHVGRIARSLIYAGVRVGGWVPWKKYAGKIL